MVPGVDKFFLCDEQLMDRGEAHHAALVCNWQSFTAQWPLLKDFDMLHYVGSMSCVVTKGHNDRWLSEQQ